MNQKNILLILTLLYCHVASFAQKTNIKDYVHIEITPDHDDWTYRTGEPGIIYYSSYTWKHSAQNIPLIYEIGPEKLPPNQTGSNDLKNGSFKVKAGTMKTPGFITCLCRTEVDVLSIPTM